MGTGTRVPQDQPADPLKKPRLEDKEHVKRTFDRHLRQGENSQMNGASQKRMLVFGWGAACAAALETLKERTDTPFQVHVVSHVSQAADCNLQEVAATLGFNCLLTDDDDEVLQEATAFAPDLIVSVSYRKRIASSVLSLGQDCLNLHPSLLPKHRGCWSGFWVIFEGDEETGVTCHRMVEKFDEGCILHQERLAVTATDTSWSLYKRLLPVTADCFRRVMDMYFSGNLPEGTPQDRMKGASYHFRKLPFDGLIQPDWSEERIGRFIRAMHMPPFEGAALVTAEGRRLVFDTWEDYAIAKKNGSL